MKPKRRKNREAISRDTPCCPLTEFQSVASDDYFITYIIR